MKRKNTSLFLLNRRQIVATSALVGSLSLGAPATAQVCDDFTVPVPENCARINANEVVSMPIGENTERVVQRPTGSFEETGYSISIDNRTIGGAPAVPDPQRRNDILAAGMDVDVRYDGLTIEPKLNVATEDLRASYSAGETVNFRSSANYPAWITRSEVRIIDRSSREGSVVATLPTRANGTVGWTMPTDGSGRYAYVVRVYDSQGRYDETQPRLLDRSAGAFENHSTSGATLTAAGEGEDNTRLRNIPLRGGMITASGQGGRPGGTVTVMGDTVPVDSSGRFAVTRIVPIGDQIITVDANGRRIIRDVQVPNEETFYVAIADLTYGLRLRDDLQSASPNFEDTYFNGRLAYYVKSRRANGWTITSSLDTGDGPIDEAFNRLGEKDPRSFLRRLDPEDLYPTYGDDSSSFDDTPSQGRFYLRVENDVTRLTWGDFNVGVASNGLLNQSRSLYGLEAAARSRSVTENGDAIASASVYAAQPDTLPQRDILRGTGGSVYFLQRQDIEGGTAAVSLQVTDPDTGRVVETVILQEGIDYTVDYIQGVLILTQPLGSTAAGTQLISSGSDQYQVDLVAQYEYTPNGTSVDGMTFGGRGEVWVTDELRFGLTALQETTDTADQRIASADLRYNIGGSSYVTAEIAQSEGRGFGRSVSTDGGLTFSSNGGADADAARALRLEGHFDLADLGSSRDGYFDLYYERKDEGFTTLSQDILETQTLYGFEAEVELTDRLAMGIDAEQFEKAGGDFATEVELRGTYDLNDQIALSAALGYTDQDTAGDATKTGQRTDVAVRLDYKRDDNMSAYVFGQGTLQSSGGLEDNNRFGVGGSSRLSDKVTVAGEVSGGTSGTGGLLRLNYASTPDNVTYLGYTLDPTRGGAGSGLVGRDDGTLVVGGNYRLNDQVSMFTETNLDFFGQKKSTTRALGVSYTPNASWTWTGGIENGVVRDDVDGDFDRLALSMGTSYTNEDLSSGRIRLEYRTEDGAGIPRDRETWALSAGYEHRVSDDWRVLANLDALYSQSDEAAFRDGEYLEASLGYAYRPVDNERLNLLFKLTHLHDLPGEDQVTASGSTDGDAQRSTVISVDGSYDLGTAFTIGGKLGYRMSEVAPRGTTQFTGSTASLAIVRVDWHIVHQWDVFGEMRLSQAHEANVQDAGALLGVYRHIGNNAKIGLGYEWGRVSDDMIDLSYDEEGLFLNVLAKF